MRWALASTDTPGMRFATSASAAGEESLTGTLAPGASATIYVRGIGAGSGHFALVASGGAALLALGGCGAGG